MPVVIVLSCGKTQVVISVAMCSGAEATFAFRYAFTAGSETMQSLVQSCRNMLCMNESLCDKEQVLMSVAMCSGAEAAFAFKHAFTAGHGLCIA